MSNIHKPDYILRALWIGSALVACTGLYVHNAQNEGNVQTDKPEFNRAVRGLAAEISTRKAELNITPKQAAVIHEVSSILTPRTAPSETIGAKLAESIDQGMIELNERNMYESLKTEKDTNFKAAVAAIANTETDDIVALAKAVAEAKRMDSAEYKKAGVEPAPISPN